MGAVAIGQPAMEGALVIGGRGRCVATQHQVALPGRAEGRRYQHVCGRDRPAPGMLPTAQARLRARAAR